MFEPGEKIICVNGNFDPTVAPLYRALPRTGFLYIVRDIVPGWTPTQEPTTAVLLEGLENAPNPHGIEPGFNPDRFRRPEDIPAAQSRVAQTFTA